MIKGYEKLVKVSADGRSESFISAPTLTILRKRRVLGLGKVVV